jgi:tetratricopeptide (TPR) repeat protein
MTAQAFKEKGNEYYKCCQFSEAIASYSQAIELDSSDPTFLSNRSAAYFESGSYNEAMQDCLQALRHPKLTSALKGKVLARLVSCICLLKNVADLDDLGLSPEHRMSLLGLHRALPDHLTQVCRWLVKQPPIFYEHCEYFPIGHDDATSAFRDNQSRVDPGKGEHLDWSSLKDSFRVLYGGVGDGRHPLATLIDFFQESDHIDRNVKLYMLFNDLNATALARLVLLLLDVQKLGSFPRFDRRNPDFVYRITAITSCYASAALHPTIYEEVRKTIHWCASSDEWRAQLPFVKFMNEETVEAIRNVFHLWKDNIDLVPTSDALLNYDPVAGGIPEDSCCDQTLNMIKDCKEKQQRQLEEMVKNIPAAELSERFPIPDLSEKQMRDMLLDVMSREQFKTTNGSMFFDKVFVNETKFLLIPQDFPSEERLPTGINLPQATKILRAAYGKLFTKSQKKKHDRVHTEVLRYLKRTWRPNPCVMDFAYAKATGGKNLTFHAVEAADALFHASFIEKPSQPKDVYDYFGIFFFQVSRCLLKLRDRITIEMCHGDILGIGMDIMDHKEERLAQGLPVTFHRIYNSNIPDYCGLLSSLVCLSPLLVTERTTFNCFKSCNVMLNTGIWRDYNEYVHSSTMADTPAELDEVAGLVLQRGDLWTETPQWMVSPRFDASQDTLLHWLRKLFLGIAFPAPRSIFSMCAEASPMNWNSFCKVIEYLLFRGVPTHWLLRFLQDLSSSPFLRCKADKPKQSPDPVPVPSDSPDQLKTHKITPFQNEFKAILSIWAARPTFPFVPSLPLDVTTFMLRGHKRIGPEALLTMPSLTLVLTVPDTSHFESLSFYEELANNRANCHIFYCLKSQCSHDILFVASRQFIHSLSPDWVAIVFRSDSWTTESYPIPVHQAICEYRDNEEPLSEICF